MKNIILFLIAIVVILIMAGQHELAKVAPGPQIVAALTDEQLKVRQEQDAVMLKRLAVEEKKQILDGPKNRRETAQILQHEFLMRNMDAAFVAEGKQATVLRMKYVLVGNPLAEQLKTDGAFLERCRTAGFVKVILDDGFGKTWTFSL